MIRLTFVLLYLVLVFFFLCYPSNGIGVDILHSLCVCVGVGGLGIHCSPNDGLGLVNRRCPCSWKHRANAQVWSSKSWLVLSPRELATTHLVFLPHEFRNLELYSYTGWWGGGPESEERTIFLCVCIAGWWVTFSSVKSLKYSLEMLCQMGQKYQWLLNNAMAIKTGEP